MARTSRYSQEVRERAVRMVFVRDADASLKLGLADDGASEAPIDSFLSPQPIAGIGWARLAVYNVLREGPHILLRNYLRSLLQLGRAQEVESRATRALSLTGEAPIWRLLRGRARIRLERYAEAERDLAAVVRRAPTNVPALLEHGVALIHLGRRSEALRELDRAYALDRDYPGLTRLRRQLRAGVR